MRIVAIGGEPGSGKSTLMKRVIDRFKMTPKYDSFKLVPYLQNDNVYILGKYEEGEVFSGTDRMSMAVQPEAVKFLASLPKDSVVIFEGDRLFNSSFLEHCNDNYDTQIIYLKTDKSVREERYKERGSEQNETWLRGRESKISNILTNMNLMFITETYENNNYDQQTIIYEKVIEYGK
ncbi:AAA domain containing protein [uncultured Caudovirales phage]|uniref:AAA domain containing protein n=1 Tax=uncultured Caudovirales phage TaxID=2100421 RepID=A0A6J5NYX8_9CAUD|nr:AAA domain containing protein [uncultured Caudovirales phage]